MLHMSANSCLFTCPANTATFTLHLALFCSNMLLYSIAPKCSIMYLLVAIDVYLIHCFIKISIRAALKGLISFRLIQVRYVWLLEVTRFTLDEQKLPQINRKSSTYNTSKLPKQRIHAKMSHGNLNVN